MLSILSEFLRNIREYFSSKNIRYYYHIRTLSRFKRRYKLEKGVKIDKYSIYVIDWLSFVGQFKEIFCNEMYLFKTDTESPVIYDCGANIGVASLYFKKIYPNAIVTAFEADDNVADILQENLHNNSLSDVKVIKKAVWVNDKGVPFSSTGSDAGSINGTKNKNMVPSLRLADMLKHETSVEMLKIDIEGAELEVLTDCRSSLGVVKNIFIEYHSWSKDPQRLSEVINVLEEAGFRMYLEGLYTREHPFINNHMDRNMDLQLMIFAYRI